jgi:GTP cyclohydrolase FolE2
VNGENVTSEISALRFLEALVPFFAKIISTCPNSQKLSQINNRKDKENWKEESKESVFDSPHFDQRLSSFSPVLLFIT